MDLLEQDQVLLEPTVSSAINHVSEGDDTTLTAQEEMEEQHLPLAPAPSLEEIEDGEDDKATTLSNCDDDKEEEETTRESLSLSVRFQTNDKLEEIQHITHWKDMSKVQQESIWIQDKEFKRIQDKCTKFIEAMTAIINVNRDAP